MRIETQYKPESTRVLMLALNIAGPPVMARFVVGTDGGEAFALV